MIADLSRIVSLIESGWRDLPVLVVGDVMLDQYIWGEVERISPEAPVPVVRAQHRTQQPGGAANVAMNLAGLGARVTVTGFAGCDTDHASLESLLADAGVQTALVPIAGVATTSKLRILSGHQQMLRLDTETPAEHPESHYTALLAEVFAALSASAVIVLSDYAKGALSYTVCRAIIEEARHLGIPVLVDPKSRSFARYQGATAICPNSRELATATGESAEDTGELLAAGQALLSSLDIPWMGVTLSEKGIAILREDSCVHVPAVARQVYDVSGAGDTVTAVLALALASNIDIDTAAELANIAAGIVVSKVGTVPVQRHELLAALSPEIALCMNEKVLPLDRMLMRVAAWRASGQHVVFTNGCFDLLHAGHISLLEKARRMGDRLIVAINTDSSVRRLKGPQRPVVAENERAQVLAALGAVDAVVIFEQDTPLQLILAIRPDVLVKGGDYSEADVIGAREVRAWGGRVELIPIVEGCSTTRLIEKAFGTRSNQRRLKRAPVNDGSRPADKKELSLAE